MSILMLFLLAVLILAALSFVPRLSVLLPVSVIVLAIALLTLTPAGFRS